MTYQSVYLVRYQRHDYVIHNDSVQLLFYLLIICQSSSLSQQMQNDKDSPHQESNQQEWGEKDGEGRDETNDLKPQEESHEKEEREGDELSEERGDRMDEAYDDYDHDGNFALDF